MNQFEYDYYNNNNIIIHNNYDRQLSKFQTKLVELL